MSENEVSPKIVVCDSLAHPKLARYNFACYEPETNTIFICNKDLLYDSILKHELIHSNRKNKISFKIYSFVFRSYKTITAYILSFFGLAGVYVLTQIEWFLYLSTVILMIPMVCREYEEFKAFSFIQNKSLRERIGE